ncbi:TRAP transporter substrate-binding protein [Pararhizobium haloflavum]|uniref:TRAP transporter substrate-binding protein n=1 Tax=Pararhizobium haloflavum TaxID=2037914 RepID=UPI000C197F3F|nr:TRAP transporter substrate-binding protein DctP [Pararhizobium haloflavum]
MKIAFLAGFAVAVAAVTAHSAERLSLSTWGSPQHYQVEEFVPLFEEKLTEKTDGEIRLRTFEAGEMVKQQFVSNAVPQGSVDISLTTLDNWSGRIPDVGILTTPLWDKSMEWTLENVKPGKPVFDYFDAKLREEGAVLLAMFDIGPPVLSANFEVTGPESFEGKAIRVFSKGSGEAVQALGAAPTIMGVGDVYSGLQRGTVQGALGGLGGAVGLKHYEVTESMFAPNGVMGGLIHAYVMNKDRFEALSPDLQAALMEAATEARDHMQQFAIDDLSKLLDEVEAHGNQVTVLDPGSDLWDAFASTLEPLSAAAKEAYSEEVQAIIAAE